MDKGNFYFLLFLYTESFGFYDGTGCSLNIVFFWNILRLWPFSVFPRCQCVSTHQAGRTPAMQQQNWQSSEKSQNVGKTQYLMNTLYM